jgi:hypothetical protein
VAREEHLAQLRDIVSVVANPESASRDWMLSVLIPTIELRDALITDVVHTIRALTETPIVAVRLIAVVDDAEKPTLTMHIRSRTAISGEQAEAVTSETLRRYASRLDLSGVKVKFTGQPSPDEPSMR